MTCACDLGPEGLESFLPLWETPQKTSSPFHSTGDRLERLWRACGGGRIRTQASASSPARFRGQAGWAGLRRRPSGAPLCPPACPSWPGHQGTQGGLGTRLLLGGPSSKISPTHGESSHHGNAEVALQPRNHAQLFLSPARSPGGACYGQAPGQALAHSHPTDVNPSALPCG